MHTFFFVSMCFSLFGGLTVDGLLFFVYLFHSFVLFSVLKRRMSFLFHLLILCRSRILTHRGVE